MRTYPSRPLVGIGIILLKSPHILLIKRKNPPAAGAWSLPGGGQELGETAEACARRELLEETALTCGPLTLIGHADSIHHDENGRIEFHYTILDFAARYASGTPTPGDDVSELAWVHPEDFPAYNLWPDAERLIHKTISQLPP